MSGIKTKYPHFLSQNILECKYEFYIQINLNLTLNIYTWFGGFRVLLTSSRWSFFIFLHNVSQVAYHWPRIPNIIFSTDVLGRVLAACWEGGSRRLGVLRPVPWTDVTRRLFWPFMRTQMICNRCRPSPATWWITMPLVFVSWTLKFSTIISMFGMLFRSTKLKIMTKSIP